MLNVNDLMLLAFRSYSDSTLNRLFHERFHVHFEASNAPYTLIYSSNPTKMLDTLSLPIR